MSESQYKISSYDITREWEKDAKIGKILKSKVSEYIDKLLEENKAPKITIEPWREG